MEVMARASVVSLMAGLLRRSGQSEGGPLSQKGPSHQRVELSKSEVDTPQLARSAGLLFERT